MKTVCAENQCNGCMACVDICPKGAIRIDDEMIHYNAFIEESKCVNCNTCHNVCPQNNPVCVSEPIKWHQGWAESEDIRLQSSSGGVASAIAYSFIKEGGEVCACIFDHGQFHFECMDNKETLKRIAGSKYVKSNPKGIYRIIKQKLREDKRILFIGLPCQVAAVKRYIDVSLQKNLYAIDLICHGTPSPKLLELFLQQYGYSLQKVKNIRFRGKTGYSISTDGEKIEASGVQDRYTMGFLDGIFYTDNCYSCPYATLKRTGDITLGDSWGGKLSDTEKGMGISLILIQTSKGELMLDRAKVHEEAVDLGQAVANNKQLKAPMVRTKKRETFFQSIQAGKNFNKAVSRCCFMRGIKQQIKRIFKCGVGKFGISIIKEIENMSGGI